MPTIDSNGIQWIASTGQQGVISRSVNEADDKRWSGNVSGVSQYGYEITAIFTFSGVTSGGHFACKLWGPNHSGDCGHEEDGECCCWYDVGIRDNGDIQLQTERPHPNNHNFTLFEDAANGPLYMDNIGIPMDGNDIGLKWVIFPIVSNGSADNGGMRLLMYVDTNPLTAGVPNNNWVKVFDFIDSGEILGDYEAPDEHDLEIRVSDTSTVTEFAGGLHWRKFQAGDSSTFGTGVGVTPPPAGQIIWDSNANGNWDNGTPRTVTDSEGSQAINGKGLYMAASGDPRLIIDGAGIGTLEADAGHGRFYVKACNYNVRLEGDVRFNDTDIDNTTWKLRNRHQMDGDCQERFGGFGGKLSRTDAGTQIELCHNSHEGSDETTLPTPINVGQWVGFRFTVQDQANGDILQKIELDYKTGSGFQTVHTATKTNAPDYYRDKQKFLQESEFWIRINNDDTGSVSYRNVKAINLDASPSNPPPPPPTPPTLYRFLSWGDNDTTTDAEDVLDQMFTETNVSRYLFAGDGPYDTDATAWINMMDSYFNTTELRETKLILTQGNHEHPESESQTAENQIEAWKSGLNNSVEGLEWLSTHIVGNVYILVMNSQDPDIDEVGSDQYNYVVTKLAEAMVLRAAGQIDWIITMVHKSWFNLLGSNPAYVTARNAYTTIFRQAQVDFMFHGHNHAYMIWKPIVAIPGNNDNTASTAVFSLAPDGRYDFSQDHGAIYVVNGNGGHEINNWGEDPDDFPNVDFTFEDFGYSVLDIQGKQATLKAKDVNGNTLHTVSVTRGEDDDGSGGTDPCPTGQHRDPVTGLCVPDGGGTNPDPTTPETIYNDLILVYNINSDSDGCICNAAPFTPPDPEEPPPDEEEPPPGGGTNINAIYDISYTGSGSDSVRIGKDSGDDNQYLQIGIVIKDSQLAKLTGKAPKRVEVPLKRRGTPGGDTAVVSVVVRSANNTLQTTIGTMLAKDISSDQTQYYAFENLSSTYQMQDGDMILIEFDKGDGDEYLIGYTKPEKQNGIKVIKRDNTMSEGDYRERDQEFAFRVFA